MAQVNNTSPRPVGRSSAPLVRFVTALEAVIAEPEERLLLLAAGLLTELVYGADIGSVRRHTYQLDGAATPFVSGYSNVVPLDPAAGPFAAP